MYFYNIIPILYYIYNKNNLLESCTKSFFSCLLYTHIDTKAHFIIKLIYLSLHSKSKIINHQFKVKIIYQ